MPVRLPSKYAYVLSSLSLDRSTTRATLPVPQATPCVPLACEPCHRKAQRSRRQRGAATAPATRSASCGRRSPRRAERSEASPVRVGGMGADGLHHRPRVTTACLGLLRRASLPLTRSPSPCHPAARKKPCATAGLERFNRERSDRSRRRSDRSRRRRLLWGRSCRLCR